MFCLKACEVNIPKFYILFYSVCVVAQGHRYAMLFYCCYGCLIYVPLLLHCQAGKVCCKKP